MPPHTFGVNSIQAEGSSGRLDVIVDASRSVSGGIESDLWHTQILAGLTLSAKPSKFSHKKSQKVTFTVTDAGQPVGGATVKCLRAKGTTSAKGTVKLRFGKGAAKGKHVCTASKVGYNSGTTTVKIT